MMSVYDQRHLKWKQVKMSCELFFSSTLIDARRLSESEGSDSEDDEDTRDLEGRTHSKGGMEIDRASAANVKRSKDEADADPEEEDVFGYTMSKLTEKLSFMQHFHIQLGYNVTYNYYYHYNSHKKSSQDTTSGLVVREKKKNP